jgi:CRISPR/Cas system-associated exonuclease Cas4 (RecB family)
MAQPRSIIKNLKYRQPDADNAFNLAKFNESLTIGYEVDGRKPKITKKESFSPSSLGYMSATCPRRWYLAFEGGHMWDDEPDAVGLATMQSGTDAHTRIQKALTNAGTLKESEKEIVSDDPPIRGFIDGIIEVDGIEAVLEVKTTRSESFMVRQNSMKGMDYHMYQLLTYLKLTGIKNGVLLYENRNDLSIVTIPVLLDERNEAIIDEAFDWMREVYAAYTAGTKPNCPFKKSSRICKSCPFYEECWSDSDGDIDIAPMVVHKW